MGLGNGSQKGSAVDAENPVLILRLGRKIQTADWEGTDLQG